MGRKAKPASQLTGNHLSKTEKNRLEKLERQFAGDSDRLAQGLRGLYEIEYNQLRDEIAKESYHILALEAHKSSALGNIHISTLIELANETSLLKGYESAINDEFLIYVGEKPVANPIIKMRQESLKTINLMKSQLGLGAIDIVTLARQKAEMNESDSLTNLFTNKTNNPWEEQ